jgi:hypothetical protein
MIRCHDLNSYFRRKRYMEINVTNGYYLIGPSILTIFCALDI